MIRLAHTLARMVYAKLKYGHSLADQQIVPGWVERSGSGRSAGKYWDYVSRKREHERKQRGG